MAFSNSDLGAFMPAVSFPGLAEVPLAKAGVKINKDGIKMVSHDNSMLIEGPA